MEKGVVFTNLASILEINKAAMEGVYADTPQNRKLGRVGMSYKQAKQNEKEADKKEKIDKIVELCDFAEIKKDKEGKTIVSFDEFYPEHCFIIDPSRARSHVSYTTSYGKTTTYNLNNEKEFKYLLSAIEQEREGSKHIKAVNEKLKKEGWKPDPKARLNRGNRKYIYRRNL